MTDLFTNQIFITVWNAWLFAHLGKFIYRKFIKKQNASFLTFFESGGFPSAHTALVMSLFFSIAFEEGWGASITVLSGILAAIVMYDAMNIRYRSGLHAKALNILNKKENFQDKPFKESLGHTYVEVAGGFALGLIIATLSYHAF